MLHSAIQQLWPGAQGELGLYRGSVIGRNGAAEAPLLPWPDQQVLMYDASWRAPLTVEGADARKWLNGMISANVRELRPGQFAPSFQLDPKGHILAMLDVVCTGTDSFLLLTDEAQQQELEQRLRKFVFVSKVKLENRGGSWAALRLRGQKASAVAAEAGLSAPAPGSAEALEEGWALTAAPGGVGQIEYVAPAAAIVATWERLQTRATPAGSVCQERDRILTRQPLYGYDVTETELPQETGQQERLSLTKGCYIGQEIVERIRARGAVHRRWGAFLFAAPVTAGAPLEVAGRAAGNLTSVTAHAGGWLALGYVRDAQPQQVVTAAGVTGHLLD
ncbi:MAG: YgfZ/GcvT domain-containing protein [Terriglobales bacterium]